eukprot:CAMPEP_0116931254 /NCGR_PEP_ID=MMETSP0467-20121206/27703_1 /TAXON_ID=283647 /ORGANISM="Mesodinium pulex, Strain SPMC105" /LENGTH=67 /DNA_ID=CAMNT_0004611651 /DNA_START=512 /DNA_END=715 /DNA_ORIENTATION=+
MHQRGVMHRDIKPNNILINEDCFAKICDFGLSRAVGPKIYSTETDTDTHATLDQGNPSNAMNDNDDM